MHYITYSNLIEVTGRIDTNKCIETADLPLTSRDVKLIKTNNNNKSNNFLIRFLGFLAI